MRTDEDTVRLNMFCEAALTTQKSLYETFRIAEQCIEEGVPGCFVEAGVYAGSQCAAMAYALQKHGQQRTVHLFDSFCGIPQAGPEDNQQPGLADIPLGTGTGALITSGVSVCSVDSVKALMFQWGIDDELLEYHRGWFQVTLPYFRPKERIAVLRLDGDLYESTKVSLEYLYPMMATGGFLIIDDYGLRGCRKAVDDYFKKIRVDPEFVFPPVDYKLAVHRNKQHIIRKKP